jgi:hypothetical protein
MFLRATQLPATSRSMSVPIEQRKASSGVQTIGSLRTLKLVSTRTGQSVRSLKPTAKHGSAGCLLANRLNARRHVDMRNARISDRIELSLSNPKELLVFLRDWVPPIP